MEEWMFPPGTGTPSYAAGGFNKTYRFAEGKFEIIGFRSSFKVCFPTSRVASNPRPSYYGFQ